MSQAEFAVVLEPSDGELQLGCNGIINATVSFEGKSAHSARPWLGENAVTKAGEWMTRLHQLEPVEVDIDGMVYREVISVTRASGGIANNIIPPRFDLNVNYRFPPTRSLKDAEAYLAEVCSEADGFVITDSAPAGPVRVDTPFVSKLAEVSGAPRAAKQGWTDVARFGVFGVAAVNYGPGETAQAHQVSESVALGRSRDGLREPSMPSWETARSSTIASTSDGRLVAGDDEAPGSILGDADSEAEPAAVAELAVLLELRRGEDP